MAPDQYGPEMDENSASDVPGQASALDDDDLVHESAAESQAAGARRAAATSSQPRLTRRERRRRIWLLVALVVLLLLLSYIGYNWFRTRQLPGFGMRGPQGIESIAPPEYLYSITGQGANRLNRPVGVAVANGRVYVVDFDKHRISVFTEKGTFLFSFQKIDGGDILSRPNVVTVYGDKVWVTDRLRRAMYVFTLDGKFVRKFDPKDKTLADWAPFAIDFASDGRFVVTDVGDTDVHKVHFFTADGRRAATVGIEVPADRRPGGPGAFFFPSSAAIANNDQVYISDGDNRRIQVYTLDGQFIQFIDSSGVPRGSDTDSKDYLYVADGLAHNVDVYDLKGKRLTQFGTQGFGPGQFAYPGFLAVNTKRLIFITDRENDQVQVWGWPVTPPIPPAIRPRTPLGWAACLSPLLLLPLLLLWRKRRVLVTPDFVEVLVASEYVERVSNQRRLKLICPVEDHPQYHGRVEQGVDLGSLIEPEEHSPSDVKSMVDRYEITERQAIFLSLGQRAAALATQDFELRRLAMLIEVHVVDIDEFVERFLPDNLSQKK